MEIPIKKVIMIKLRCLINGANFTIKLIYSSC